MYRFVIWHRAPGPVLGSAPVSQTGAPGEEDVFGAGFWLPARLPRRAFFAALD